VAIEFPNRARSYDESARRVRFLGHDGMFEIRFFVDIDVLANGPCEMATSEQAYLAAFDRFRARIIGVAERVYTSKPKNLIVLKRADFKSSLE